MQIELPNRSRTFDPQLNTKLRPPSLWCSSGEAIPPLLALLRGGAIFLRNKFLHKARTFGARRGTKVASRSKREILHLTICGAGRH
jgi:hypothetical protein